MPIRIVREGINSSPRINALSRNAELFYRRLMSVADDYGRFHGSPATIRGACWPTCPEHVTEQEISDWLEETYHVHSKCLAGDKQHRPLVIPYESDGAKYIQLTDFKQQTRSASKFPEPANHLLSNCESNDQPRRRRETETETFFGDGDEDVDVKAGSSQTEARPAESSPSWMLDETYVAFAGMANKFWPRILNEELANGHRWYWTKFSLEEKLTATRNLRDRLTAGEDGEYVKHMPDYLKTEWKRGPKLVAVNKLGPNSVDKQQQRRHETNEGAKMLRNMR